MSEMKIMNQHTDEVDIAEFVKTIWLGKKIIISSIILFSIIAIIYTSTVQQWWTSSAIVTTGQYRGVGPLRQQVANFHVVSNNQDKAQEQININELNSVFNENKLLNQFITEFNAFKNKKDFILSNPIMKKYANGKDDTAFINNWAKRIQANSTGTREQAAYTLSYQATNAKISHQLLLSYIQFIDKKSQNYLFDGLESIIEDQKIILESQLLSLEIQAKELKRQELVKTGYALKIANAAKAIKPIPQMNDDQFFSINLGSEGLTEKIKILKNIKDLSLFEPRMTMVTANLDLLSKIKLNRNVKLETISYLQNINSPITSDKHKHVLIVLIGSLLGCLLGIAVVLLKSSINTNKE